MLNIILFLLFIYLQFKLFQEIYKEKLTQLLTSTVLICAIGLGTNPDLVAYNSEIVVITLLSGSFLIYLKAKTNGKLIYFFISGILAALVPLAKEQALPIAVSILLFYVIQQLRLKNYKIIICLSLGGIILLLGFFGYIVITDTGNLLNILWSSSKVYMIKGLGGVQSNFLVKGINFIKCNYLDATNGVLSLMAIIGVATFIKRKEYQFTNSTNYNLLFLTLFGITLYITINPGNSFYHYTILHFFFFSFFSAYLLNHFKKVSKSITLIAIVLITIAGLFNSKRIFPLYALQIPIKHDIAPDTVNSLLKTNVKNNEHILVWGWDSKYYLETKTLRSSLFLVPIFIETHYPKRKETIAFYLKDIKKLKPKIIIEAVGPGRFYFKDTSKWRIDRVSNDLKIILNKKYRLLAKDSNYRIFILNHENWNHKSN
jgi:hypothetical protein